MITARWRGGGGRSTRERSALLTTVTLGSVIAHVERVFDDAADQLRRKDVGEFRGEGCGERVEVVALVSLDAAYRCRLSAISCIATSHGSSDLGGYVAA